MSQIPFFDNYRLVIPTPIWVAYGELADRRVKFSAAALRMMTPANSKVASR